MVVVVVVSGGPTDQYSVTVSVRIRPGRGGVSGACIIAVHKSPTEHLYNTQWPQWSSGWGVRGLNFRNRVPPCKVASYDGLVVRALDV